MYMKLRKTVSQFSDRSVFVIHLECIIYFSTGYFKMHPKIIYPFPFGNTKPVFLQCIQKSST